MPLCCSTADSQHDHRRFLVVLAQDLGMDFRWQPKSLIEKQQGATAELDDDELLGFCEKRTAKVTYVHSGVSDVSPLWSYVHKLGSL